MDGKFFLLAIGGEWLLSVIDDCVSMVTECQDVFFGLRVLRLRSATPQDDGEAPVGIRKSIFTRVEDLSLWWWWWWWWWMLVENICMYHNTNKAYM